MFIKTIRSIQILFLYFYVNTDPLYGFYIFVVQSLRYNHINWSTI